MAAQMLLVKENLNKTNRPKWARSCVRGYGDAWLQIQANMTVDHSTGHYQEGIVVVKAVVKKERHGVPWSLAFFHKTSVYSG